MSRLLDCLCCRRRSRYASSPAASKGNKREEPDLELDLETDLPWMPAEILQLEQWLVDRVCSATAKTAEGKYASSDAHKKRRLLRKKLRVVVAALSGDMLGPLDFEVSTNVSELQTAIMNQWSMPPQGQRWLVGSTAVDLALDSPSTGMAPILLAVAEERPEDLDLFCEDDTIVFVNCYRVPLSEEAQERLDIGLLVAAAEGDCAQIELCLKHGADPTASMQVEWPDHLRATLFSQAAGAERATDLLLDSGCPLVCMIPYDTLPGRQHPCRDMDVLFRHRCQQQRLVELVKLLHSKVDPNLELRDGEGVKDTRRGAPLHAICSFRGGPGNTALATLLCRLGANVNAEDAEGDTPLSHARHFQQKAVCDVIEKYGGKMQGTSFTVPYRGLQGWK